jgi:hypothetical protein
VTSRLDAYPDPAKSAEERLIQIQEASASAGSSSVDIEAAVRHLLLRLVTLFVDDARDRALIIARLSGARRGELVELVPDLRSPNNASKRFSRALDKLAEALADVRFGALPLAAARRRKPRATR